MKSMHGSWRASSSSFFIANIFIRSASTPSWVPVTRSWASRGIASSWLWGANFSKALSRAATRVPSGRESSSRR